MGYTRRGQGRDKSANELARKRARRKEGGGLGESESEFWVRARGGGGERDANRNSATFLFDDEAYIDHKPIFEVVLADSAAGAVVLPVASQLAILPPHPSVFESEL